MELDEHELMRAAANDESMDFEKMKSMMLQADGGITQTNLPQILIVDDETLNIEVIGLLLLGKKIVTESALSGREAFEKIKERAKFVRNGSDEMFKIILLDYCMPEIDGPETAKMIRKYIEEEGLIQPHISCCSAYNEETYVNRAFESGMDSFISKPVTLEQILKMMGSMNN